MKWLVVLLLVPLAGCIGDEPSVQEASDPGVELDDDGGWHLFNETFDVTVGQIVTPTSRHSFGSNCMNLPASDLEEAKWLRAELTWTPLKPALQALQLKVASEEGQEWIEGTSPLVVEVTDVTPHEFFEDILVMAQTVGPVGADLNQPATLKITAEYYGEPSIEASRGGCSFS